MDRHYFLILRENGLCFPFSIFICYTYIKYRKPNRLHFPQRDQNVMKTKRGQGTLEYLIFLTALIGFFIFFLTNKPLAPTLKIIFQTPVTAITNTTFENTTLDIYGPWPSSGPGVTFIGYGTAWSWTDNQVGWTPGCNTSTDTCSTIEPNGPPAVGNQNCYPGMDYDCHEVWCWWGNTLQFDKHCRTATMLVDTCPGSAEISPYLCQRDDDFTCTDISTDFGCLAADVPGGCWQGISSYTRQRTIRCTPLLF